MLELIPFYVIMIAIWGIVMSRHLIFSLIGQLGRKGKRYQKSGRVDLGITIMFASIILGVTIFALVEELSVDLTAAIIVIGLCVGGFIVAMNVGDERRQNGA
jgi:cytochrome c biogenesis protein CcdA